MENSVLTKKLSRLGRLGRNILKRYMYSQMAIYSGFKIAIGKDQPLMQFKIENDPPSIYWVYRIKPSEIDNLAQKLRIPPQFSLCPIRCLNTDEPAYLLTVNAYRVSGLAKGLRAEWSVFVRDSTNTPRYMIVDARSSTSSMDPVNIITKAPSAELRPGQKDSDSLPEYDTLDRVLYEYIELRNGPKEIVAKGFDKALVDRVLKLVNTNEYKRNQFCPIIRISCKAFGVGRRVPIVGKYLS